MTEAARFKVVLIGSSVLSAAGALPAVMNHIPPREIGAFSLIQVALAVVCFRWWYRPVYKTPYNYFSPLAFIASLGYVYGGPGNMVGFAGRDQILFHNPGAWEYCLIPALAAVPGILLFDWLYRKTSRALEEDCEYPQIRATRATGSRARFAAYALLWTLVAVGIHFYLGQTHQLATETGSISDSEFSNVANQSRPVILTFAWAAASVVLLKARGARGRIFAVLLMASLAWYLVGSVSRTYVLTAAACTLFVAMQLRCRISKAAVLSSLALCLAAFAAITGYKAATQFGAIESAGEGTPALDVMTNRIDPESALKFLMYLNADRLAALEFAGAIERSHEEQGTPWMHGYHNWLVISRSVPGFIWPGKPDLDPEVAVNDHFDLEDMDQLSTPISSGLADFGPVGIIFGLGLLGTMICICQHVVWKLPGGWLMYFGSIGLLLRFEIYTLEDPVDWARCLLVLIMIDVGVRAVVGVMASLRTLGSTPVPSLAAQV